MKQLNKKSIKYQLVITFLFLVHFVQAQPSFDGGDDTLDVPAVPIDKWIFLMVLIGITMIVYYTKKKDFSKS